MKRCSNCGEIGHYRPACTPQLALPWEDDVVAHVLVRRNPTGMSVAQIASYLGTTRQTVYAIEQGALYKLRQRLQPVAQT